MICNTQISQDKTKEEFERIIEKTSDQLSVRAISFAVFVLYSAVSALNTKDREIFFNSELRMPIFSIDVPIVLFYYLTPLIIFLLHGALLLQLRELDGLVSIFLKTYSKSRYDVLATQKFATSTIAQFISNIRTHNHPGPSHILVYSSLIILPIFTLFIIQLQFLRFQDSTITWIHRFIIMSDIMAVYWLFPRRSDKSAVSLKMSECSIVALCFFGLFISVAVFTQKPIEPARTGVDGFLARLGLWVFSEQPTTINSDEEYWPPQTVGPFFRRFLILDAQSLINDEHIRLVNANQSPNDSRSTRTVAIKNRNFNFARFDGSDLRGYHFFETSFFRAGFIEANLDGAVFRDSELFGADFYRASMRNVNLEGADLRSAILFGANIEGGRLGAANMSGADLRQANLRGVNLREAWLIGADLSRADLRGINGNGLNAQGANFARVRLAGAHLESANLQAAVFAGASLDAATLRNADLQAADLAGSGSPRTSLRGASLSETRLWGTSPGSLTRPAEIWGDNAVLWADILSSRVLLEAVEFHDVSFEEIPESSSPEESTNSRWTAAISNWLWAIPPGTNRNRAEERFAHLQRLSSQQGQQTEAAWRDAIELTLVPVTTRLSILAETACAAAARPHVARAIIARLALDRPVDLPAADFVTRLQDAQNCVGVVGLNSFDEDRLATIKRSSVPRPTPALRFRAEHER